MKKLFWLQAVCTAAISLHLQNFAATGETLPVTKPLTPTEARKSFHVEDGLRVELVAAEPLVQSPSAIAWNEDARLLVAENPGYPTGPGPGKPPVGKIVELKDTNYDGISDQRIEFATGLSFPNGLMPWNKGWLVTDAPDLLWFCDTDGDGKADVREVWFTGFATNQTTQLRACYPTLGPDGWIYVSRGWSGGVITSPKWTNLPPVDLRNGDFRFLPDGSKAEAIGGNSQFGLVLDDVGRRFFTSNRNPIMHAVAWPHWWKRMPAFHFNEIVQDVSPVGADAKVFPLSADLTTSGFMPELMSTPHAGTFTSACGLHEFWGEGLPARFQGSWFVCEPAQNLVQRQIMEPDGPSFKSRRATEGKDFLASTDTWFHPVYAATGPDGALYIADMYRNFIDHPEYLPKDAREKIDFDSGKEMGRIWRIVSAEKKSKAYSLPTSSKSNIATALSSENKWRRETALRLIIEKCDPEVISLVALRFISVLKTNGIHDGADLKKLARERKSKEESPTVSNEIARTIQLLGNLSHQKQLNKIGALQNEVNKAIFLATLSPSPTVREAAFRVFQLSSDARNPLPDVGKDILHLWSDDPSPALRFHLAYSLGQGDYRRMTEALVNILRRDAANKWTRAVVLSGLSGRMNEFAEKWFSPSWTELPGKPLDPIGFDDSSGMLDLAYEMGLVYGAPTAVGGANLIKQALAEKADGTGWQAALLTGRSTAARKNPALKSKDAPLLAQTRSDSNLQSLNIAERLQTITATNAQSVLDRSLPPSKRKIAVRFLGEFPSASGKEALLKLITPLEPKDLQIAAARSLATSLDKDLAEQLCTHQRWGSFSPEVREVFLEGLLSKPALSKVLLLAIDQDQISASSINPARRKSLQQSAHTEIKDLANKVLGSTGGEDRLKVYQEYKSVLDLKPNGSHGAEVFNKTCAACHQHNGKGYKVGPDLTGVKNQPADALLYHILVPDAEIYAGFQNYEVELRSGESHSGILISENESSITLQRALGEKTEIPRNQIDTIRSTHSSLMPNELEKTMTKQDFADLIGFLKGTVSP